jgi:hypothetical protein
MAPPAAGAWGPGAAAGVGDAGGSPSARGGGPADLEGAAGGGSVAVDRPGGRCHGS